jgi:hypothetical protein
MVRMLQDSSPLSAQACRRSSREEWEGCRCRVFLLNTSRQHVSDDDTRFGACNQLQGS